MLREELIVQARRLQRVTRLTGFGELDSGRALARKFELKALGGERSAIEGADRAYRGAGGDGGDVPGGGGGLPGAGAGHGRRAAGLVLIRLAVLLGVVLLAGCVPGSVSGPAPTTTTGLPPVETVPFDPCTVADSTVTALTLDPATKERYGDRLKQQGAERGCAWKNAPLNSTVSLDVGRSTRVLQEYADNTSFRDKVRTSVGARDAVRFNTGAPETNCSLAVQVTGGVVVFTANTSSVTVNVAPTPACPQVQRLAAGIEPLLPR